jgi:hypothetical protein
MVVVESGSGTEQSLSNRTPFTLRRQMRAGADR